MLLNDTENAKVDEDNNMIIKLNYSADYLNQTITISVKAFDGLNTRTQQLKVKITDNYPPKLISPLPDVVFVEEMSAKKAFNLDSYFQDLDENDELNSLE